MKQFFSRYSYDSMRMFLDQFAISLFGFCLALTAVQMETTRCCWSSALRPSCSISP